MAALNLRRSVRIRIDVDAVDVEGVRMGRPRAQRWDVPEEGDPFAVLERVLRRSELLRPGRACDVRVELESPRTRYRTVQGEGDERCGPEGFDVLLPEVLRDVLQPILARRRVHGSAFLASGPAIRTFRSLRSRVDLGPIGRGLVVDRSSSAVTVLLVDGVDVRWARGAPAEDAPEVAAILLRRVAEVVAGSYGLNWWHLTDVASPADERRRRREAREFEARCHALVGHLPRMLPSLT